MDWLGVLGRGDGSGMALWCEAVPAIVDKALFSAAQEQLRENRTHARLGPRRPGHLLQGLTCCALCGYAFYARRLAKGGRAIA
jgi:hypothetical protein